MCRENCGSGRPFAAIVAAISLFFSLSFNTLAQELPPQVVALIERQAEDGGNVEEITAHYEELAARGLSINGLSRRQLEASGLFSAFQTESILDYRKTYGDILSQQELALVDGFNESVAALIASFFNFASSNDIAAPYQEPFWKHELTTKVKGKYTTEGVGITTKYRAAYGETAVAGFTADSDAGERLAKYGLPDFVSGYVQFKRDGILKQLIIGDYSIRAGQGLSCWKAFSLTAFGTPSSIIKSPSGARPYTSTDESNFFRGAAANLSWRERQLTLFASGNSVDARVLGDSVYTSIVTGGYHRTEAELAKRHAMREYVAGAAFSTEKGRWRYGLTGLVYKYDKANGRVVKEYNKYQMYDGLWGNISADFYCYYHNWRLFGEAAVDMHGAPAVIGGALWSPSYNLEMSLAGRWYSRSYIATHSGAYSSLSNCANQRGVTASARWISNSRWTVDANAQYSYYPWTRYGIEGPSQAFKYRLAVSYASSQKIAASLQLSGSPQPRWRADCKYALTGRWSARARYAGNPGGHGGFLECNYSPSASLLLAARLTAWATDGWDSRLYFYEGGVPQTFSIGARSGKGTGAYLLARYAPVRNIKLWVKISEQDYAFFILIFIPG